MKIKTVEVVAGGKKYECIIGAGPRYGLISEPKKVTVAGKSVDTYRLVALQDFADVKAGDLGGYSSVTVLVDKDTNSVEMIGCIPQEGRAWIYDDAVVVNSIISRDTSIEGNNTKVVNSEVRNSGIGCTNSDDNIVVYASKVNGSTISCPAGIMHSELISTDIEGELDAIRRVTKSKLVNVYTNSYSIAIEECNLTNLNLEEQCWLTKLDIRGKVKDELKTTVTGNSETIEYEGPNIEIVITGDTINEEELKRQIKEQINKKEKLSKITDKAVTIKNRLS